MTQGLPVIPSRSAESSLPWTSASTPYGRAPSNSHRTMLGLFVAQVLTAVANLADFDAVRSEAGQLKGAIDSHSHGVDQARGISRHATAGGAQEAFARLRGVLRQPGEAPSPAPDRSAMCRALLVAPFDGTGQGPGGPPLSAGCMDRFMTLNPPDLRCAYPMDPPATWKLPGPYLARAMFHDLES